MSDVINAHDLGVAGGYIIEAAMQVDIDQLKAENAKLRNDTDLLRAMLSQVQIEKRCYMAENAKLRELVRDMFGGYKGAVEMLPSSYSKNVAEKAVMDISDRMRELGVVE